MTSNARLQQQLPPDASTRTRVLDPTRSFLVQAPAGSGKTELLMQRYLSLLGQGSVEQPEAVLAITFTQKAAGEMRSRVLAALENAAGPEPQEVHKRLSHQLAVAAVERDRAMGWDILRNPSRLQIRTVDSFCDQISRHTPLLSGLGATPAIAADFRPLYREAAERTLRLIGGPNAGTVEAVSHVLRDQDNDLWRVTGLLMQLLEKRDQWLRILGRSDTHSPEQLSELRRRLEESLEEAVRYELGLVQQAILELPAAVQESLLAYARFGANNVVGEHLLSPMRTADRLPDAEPDSLPQWRALQYLCLTAQREFRKTLNNRDGFPPLFREYRDKCVEFLKQLAESPQAGRLQAALCRVDRIPPCRYSDEQWASLEALFRVLPLAVAQLRLVFAERHEIDYIEVAQAALSAMESDGHPTDLALSLGYRIQHVLVDEFQDTSVSQLRLLERLVRVWTEIGEATLFVVGDPMQSIYSFRQAEVTLFGEAARHGVAGWPLEEQNLQANFRSVPQLVQWLNTSFSRLLTEDNPITGAVRHIEAVAAKEDTNATAVFCYSVPPRDYDAEADEVLKIVRGELARGTESVALLVRSRTHLKSIVPKLRDAGVRFRAKEIDLLGERQTVRDLHAITRAVLHPADRIAWLAVLRAPCCGFELADLWELCRGDSGSTIPELLRQRNARLSPRAREAAARVLRVFDASAELRGRRTLRSLVESVWISLGGYAALSPHDRESAERDAAAYLDLLQHLDKAGEVEESQLQDGLESLYAPADTCSSVQLEIMTIHGAKGLEFDTVILPGLNRMTDRNKKQLLNWKERVLNERDGLLLAPLEPVGPKNRTASVAGYIQALANDCTGEESKRLLYVAATRARHRLHLVTTLPEPEGLPHRGSFLSYLWNIEAFPEAEAVEAETDRQRAPQVLHRLPPAWSLSAPDRVAVPVSHPGMAESRLEEPQHTFDWVKENMRRVGTVTHRLLQQVGNDGLNRWTPDHIRSSLAAIRALLLQEGVPPAELDGASRQVSEALLRTIQDPNGRWVLEAHPEAQSEMELSAILDGAIVRVKLDRTFVAPDGVRWVVDFKTTNIEGGSREQYIREQVTKYTPDLRRYARVLQQYETRPVRAGLYFALMGEWRPVELGEDVR